MGSEMKRTRLFALLLGLISAGLAEAQTASPAAGTPNSGVFLATGNSDTQSIPMLNSAPAPLLLNALPAADGSTYATPAPQMAPSPQMTYGMQMMPMMNGPVTTRYGSQYGGGGQCGPYGCGASGGSSYGYGSYGGNSCQPQCGPDACFYDMQNPCGNEVFRFFPQDTPLKVYGWADAGVVLNTGSPASKFNGPYNSVARSNEAMFNQAYLISELQRPAGPDWGIGARVDLLYGADYLVAQSIGFETNQNFGPKWNSNPYYGLAIPQAYAEIGNDSFVVQGGHFYTVVGYEGVQSNSNFFYSHAYSYQFAGPFTEWGALATIKTGQNLEIQAGPVNQWNTLDGTQNTVQFLGKVKYTSDNRNWWTSFAIVTGDQPNNPAGLPGIFPAFVNRTRYSLILDSKFGDGFEYVFHHWLGAQQIGTPSLNAALWYGIDQYLYYTMSDRVKLGGRFEWFRDEDGTRVGLTLPTNPNAAPLPGNYFSFTAGPNFTPNPNVTFRPEIRYDIYQGQSNPFNDGKQKHQLMLAADVIIRF